MALRVHRAYQKRLVESWGSPCGLSRLLGHFGGVWVIQVVVRSKAGIWEARVFPCKRDALVRLTDLAYRLPPPYLKYVHASTLDEYTGSLIRPIGCSGCAPQDYNRQADEK